MKFSIFKKKENNVVRNTLVVLGMLALFFLAYKASVEQASINFRPDSAGQNENNQSQLGDNNSDADGQSSNSGDSTINSNGYESQRECGGNCVSAGHERGICIQKGEESKNMVNVGECAECKDCYCYCFKKE